MPAGALERVARSIVAEGVIPSVQISVWRRGASLVELAVGKARLAPPWPTTLHTPYDLASVTKPLVGAGVAAALVERGTLDLDAPVADTLRDVDPRITARMLLNHSSGYPAWAPLYEQVDPELWGTGEARRQIFTAARRVPLDREPGVSATYSDLGFLVLCQLMERLSEARIDAMFERLVRSPADVDLRWGWSPRGDEPAAAATEDCPVRGRVVQGQVHDLNAFAMGGVSTHAGLFGTAREVARLADAWHDPTVLPPREGALCASLCDCRPFWRADGPGSHRLGWDAVTRGGYTSTGSRWPDDGVGHLGYTGTSLWLAPSEGLSMVVLTNRVHPHDDQAHKDAIRVARPLLHDALWEELA